MSNISGPAKSSSAKGSSLSSTGNDAPSNHGETSTDLLMRTDSALERFARDPTSSQALSGQPDQHADGDQSNTESDSTASSSRHGANPDGSSNDNDGFADSSNSLNSQHLSMGAFDDSSITGALRGLKLAGNDANANASPTTKSSTGSPLESSNGTAELEPILIEAAVKPRTPSSEELGAAATRAQVRLDHGDRAGAYIELYKVTGSEQLLLQAQITTYSGAVGGMALEGNFRAKMANPDDYKITLDQFSHDIDQAVVGLARDSANLGRPEEFNKHNIMRVDGEVWARNGMALHFPGNAQWIGVPGMEHLAQSIGSEEAILSQDEIELGRRPAEFANDPRYSTETSSDDRFITVVNNETNRIELFYDTQFESDRGESVDGFFTPDLEQADNTLPSNRIVAERQMKMDFLQAGTFQKYDDLPAFIENAARPPENPDRVFDYNGTLYQVSDRQLFEQYGVNFEKLTMTGLAQTYEGFKLVTSLNEVGGDVERLIDNPGAQSESQRDQEFQSFVADGSIVPLSDKETQYYKSTLQSMAEQGLSSPYQSTDDAMKELGSNLAAGLMYVR